MVRALSSALLACLVVVNAGRAQTSVATELERYVQAIREAGRIEVEGVALTRASGIVELYEENAFQPLWANTRTAAELDVVIRTIEADGLRPSDYHQAEIGALSRAPPTSRTSARLDLLRTDALIRLMHDLRYGRATTLRPAFTAGSLSGSEADVARLRGAIVTGRVAAEVDALRPDHSIYRGLSAALADLRRIERAGGWSTLPDGRPLRRDSADARVVLLRHRLAAEGYADAMRDSSGDRFDAALEAAVRSFQHRHGLNEDGIVGPATVAELNVPVERRIEQVRANLERARWITHGLPDTFLAVNIAGAKAYLVRGGTVAFESRAVVGAVNTATPVFRASLQYLDLNPTWTVPPGIVGEVLAAVRRDPRYLERNDFVVLDRNGRRVDASRVDFAGYTARTFPYVFRQEPGPANPLGRIKFMFPNRYNVYLHDTPARELFGREQRTFSHGCIRVEDPLRLAELVLDDVAWSRAAIEAAMADGRTRTIRLEKALPVLLLYWTASTDLHGELHYYRDVYERDAPLLRELNRR